MSLPIVDLSGFDSGDPAARAEVISTIRRACLDKGFFTLVGHGIAQARLDAVLEQGRRLFALPLADKQRLAIENSPTHRGYEKMRGQTFEAGLPPDLKEGFTLGTEMAADDPHARHGIGPNQWPDGLTGWRETIEAYQAEATALSCRLLRAIALSLDVEEDYFADLVAAPLIANLRLLHYPSQPANATPGEKGCGAHTDWGAVTLLLQDEVGGLQVQDGDAGWINVAPVRGAFIVNLGDLMLPWTNGRYRSTMHRVINRTGRERYSAAFFFDGNPDYVATCIPTCLAPGEMLRFPPLSVGQHLQRMAALTKAA